MHIKFLCFAMIWIEVSLKTNIRDDQVCSTETTAPRWLRNTLPSLCGRMESERIWKFELSPWTPATVRMSIASTPSAFGEAGQGNGVRGSAYYSTSLRAADYYLFLSFFLIFIQGSPFTDRWSSMGPWFNTNFVNTIHVYTNKIIIITLQGIIFLLKFE